MINKPYSPNETSRYWVVRADSGKYYEHFIQFGIVAIGHLDILRLEETPSSNFCPDFDELNKALTKAHTVDAVERKEEKGKAFISNHYNQAKHFINDIQVGDWVITTGRAGECCVGRIISPAYVKAAPLGIIINETTRAKSTLSMNLRRQVAWGPRIKKKEIPYGVKASLKSSLTIFNVDDHWTAICHMLYPVFIKGDNIYLSAKIKQSENISNYHISQFLNFLNNVEVLSSFAERQELESPEDYTLFFQEFAKNNLFTLTTKAHFYSEGDIWSVVTANPKTSLSAVLIMYGMAFGNTNLGMDGLVDLQTRQKLWDIAIEKMKDTDMDEVKDKLQLQLPSYDTEAIEVDTLDSEQHTFV